MDVKGLVRDPSLAKTAFFTTKENVLMAKEKCMAMIPKRYVEVKLATTGSENKTLGVCAWIVGNKYFITMTNAFIPLNPISVTETNVDGDIYVLYHFEANSVVCPNLALVCNSGIVFHIFTELIAKARTPWFMTYLDRCNVFNSAPKHAGTKITEQMEVTELIISANTRVAADRSLMLRHVVKKESDLYTIKSLATSIRTIEYSATSTITRVGGSYLGRGINSALNNPSERVEQIEEYLRQ